MMPARLALSYQLSAIGSLLLTAYSSLLTVLLSPPVPDACPLSLNQRRTLENMRACVTKDALEYPGSFRHAP
jgi:hypothetical protein